MGLIKESYIPPFISFIDTTQKSYKIQNLLTKYGYYQEKCIGCIDTQPSHHISKLRIISESDNHTLFSKESDLPGY